MFRMMSLVHALSAADSFAPANCRALYHSRYRNVDMASDTHPSTAANRLKRYWWNLSDDSSSLKNNSTCHRSE